MLSLGFATALARERKDVRALSIVFETMRYTVSPPLICVPSLIEGAQWRIAFFHSEHHAQTESGFDRTVLPAWHPGFRPIAAQVQLRPESGLDGL